MSDLKQAMDFSILQVEMREALDFASYKAEMEKYSFPSELQDAFNAAFLAGYSAGGKATLDGLRETLKEAGAFNE